MNRLVITISFCCALTLIAAPNSAFAHLIDSFNVAPQVVQAPLGIPPFFPTVDDFDFAPPTDVIGGHRDVLVKSDAGAGIANFLDVNMFTPGLASYTEPATRDGGFQIEWDAADATIAFAPVPGTAPPPAGSFPPIDITDGGIHYNVEIFAGGTVGTIMDLTFFTTAGTLTHPFLITSVLGSAINVRITSFVGPGDPTMVTAIRLVQDDATPGTSVFIDYITTNPEPSSLMLGGIAICCLAGYGWKKRNRSEGVES